jgi:mRNA interferase MazF
LNPVRGREQAGLRPVLILSHELFNRRSETVIAMAITSKPQAAGFPLTLALPAEMLPKPSWVKISQIRAISVDRLGKKIAAVDAETLGQRVDGLLELIS